MLDRPEAYAERVPPLDEAFARLWDPDDWDARLVPHLHELRQTHAGPPIDVAGDVVVDQCTTYPSSLHVRGDFVFSSHVLVLGNLEVDGAVVGEPEHAILMVVGDLSARVMAFLRSYLCITGSVESRELLLGTCDGFARVGGRVTTPLFLQEHWEQLSLDGDEDALDRLDATFRCDIRSAGYRAQYPRPYASAELSSVLSAKALEACREGDAVDPWALLDFVRSGGSLELGRPGARGSSGRSS